MKGLLSCLATLLFFFTALQHSEASCRISPPFRHHKVISLTARTPKEASFVTILLKQYCELFLLNGPSHELVPNFETLIVITPVQYQALLQAARNPSSRSLVPPFKLLSDDVETTIANGPYQRTSYRGRSPSNLYTGEASRSLDVDFYSQYSSLKILEEKWKSLPRLYSPHVKIEVLGQSRQGRDIFAIRIGNTSDEDPRRILLNAMQHAREWISAHVATYLAEALAVRAAGPDAEPLSNVEVIIIPLVNPDGYVYSNETYRFARKNRHKAGCSTPERDGVDLNRNWGTDYGGSQSTSRNPCDQVYIGSGAFSEPETKAVRALVLRTPGVKAHMDIHSYGQVILGAWGYTRDEPPRNRESNKIGVALERALTATNNKRYVFGRAGDLLYLASGIMTDWVTSQGILSYTLELRPPLDSAGLSGFELPESEIEPTCRETLDGIRLLLSYADNPSASLIPGPDGLTKPTQEPERGDRLSTGAIVGIALGITAVVALTSLIVALFLRHRNGNNGREGDSHVGVDAEATEDGGGDTQSQDEANLLSVA